ncbi:hypothetical protein [Hymenobacter psychrophilus]|uniref:Uncharacterized protein n=1 Tax=Hymenobacter psychrophilus TaxID=651662 RepID=A0A1H3H5C8_9BACT|nr:hypothetical protein [Hymenobacter psychrophilus]SDY10415.1 hypothetical protein SAMN04488069_105295 [Hymenobacter psychrophilus]
MFSTLDLTGLPPAADLQRLGQALAMLDAINSPDPEYRYYTYDPHWDTDEQLLEMNDGEGDQLFVLFRPEGCCINGYLSGHEAPAKDQLTRGLPAAFEEFMFGEPVASIGTSFCLWYTPAHGWQTGVVDKDEDDGSEDLLAIFDLNPETYTDWANGYYLDETEREPLDEADVARFYQHEPLTKATAQALNADLTDWAQLAAEAEIIGYPHALD